MNKQQLASKIWESANKMRSKIEANEYKDYILGFIFYKFLSEKELKFLRANDFEQEDIEALQEDDEEIVEFIQKGIGYYISYDHLFSTWLKKGADFDVSDVREALSAFSRLINESHKGVFTGIFDTLQTGLSKLGTTSGQQTKAITDLLFLIKDIPMSTSQDYDVLGFIYEYLISNFAANAGKKAGEFYTPHEVSLLMSEIIADYLKDRKEINIYDPTSGSGSLLINIGQSVAKYMDNKNNIKYYAQELKENTYNLTRMNLIMRDILPDNIIARNADTLEDDWPYFDENDPTNTYEPLYLDAVVSNPPYSQQWNPTNKENDPRYNQYGLAPKGKADYAFLLHDLYHLKPDGIMTIVLPHGVLFRGGEEGEIRRNLIERDNIDAIIGLPANIFFGTGIPTIIMILKQKRQTNDILIIDASKGFEKVGKNNKLRASDIKRIADTVIHRRSINKYSRVVSKEEIRKNDYNLNIPRYVDSSEKAESWDIYASMYGGIPKKEIEELDVYWKEFPNLKDSLFEDNGSPYLNLKIKDIKETVTNSEDTIAFKKRFRECFNEFPNILKSHLIDQMKTISITKEEGIIAEYIADRLKHINLIDYYDAYQLLDNEWSKISGDLELIQAEGETALTKVDPLMVLKKKGDKEEEVQNGYIGHILPFDLIQKHLLQNELKRIKEEEDRLSQITSEREGLFEELSEEDKENDFVNDDKTDFVNAAIKKEIKKKAVDKETLSLLKKVQELIDEEKKVKKELKQNQTSLEIHTKETIESLSIEQAKKLLEYKWIVPIYDSLNKLTEDEINNLISKLEAIAKKYEETFADIEKQIHETEQSLLTMIDELNADEFDLKGLQELKKLLGGTTNV